MRSVFKRPVATKVYRVEKNIFQESGNYYDKPELWTSNEQKGIEVFYERDIDEPVFSVNEWVYIDELEKYFQIRDIARSVEGYMIYHCHNDPKIEEDLESKAKAEKELEEETAKYNKWLSPQNIFDKLFIRLYILLKGANR
jgi:hypothetical protein